MSFVIYIRDIYFKIKQIISNSFNKAQVNVKRYFVSGFIGAVEVINVGLIMSINY